MNNLKKILAFIILLISTESYSGKKSEETTPLYLRADKIYYNQDKDVTQARGNVEIYHSDGYVLLADEVDYRSATNQLDARGNVIIHNGKGEVIFAKQVSGSPNFREAKIERPAAITQDNRRIIAIAGYKDGNKTRLEKGVYTPCISCKEKSEKPLWQIRAREIIHDEEDQDIIYKDAWLELWGTPVFYLPRLSQPDPSVKRRSGLIGIKVASSKRNGISIIPKYYYTFAPNSDVIFNPIISSKEKPILQATYRHRFRRAEMNLSGSVTQSNHLSGKDNTSVKKGSFMPWSTNSTAEVDLSDTWRLSMKYRRAGDITYINKLRVEEGQMILPSYFQSDLQAEGFNGKNYTTIKMHAFQTTGVGVSQRKLPYILPRAAYSFVTDPSETWGSHFYGDVGMLSVVRKSGADVQRLTTRGGWEIPFYTDQGDLFTFTAQARIDGYHASHFIPGGKTKALDISTARAFPQVKLEWNRPLMTENFVVPVVVSPVVSVIGAPLMGVKNTIPNEDSLGGIELDEVSLLSFNRFTGLDRLDSGSRVNYGVVLELHPKNWQLAKVFIGQSYALNKNKAIPGGSGVSKGFSDIVGILDFAPTSYFKVRYRYLFNHKDMRARRSQAGFSLGEPIFKVSGNYLYFDKNGTNRAFNGKEQINGVLSSNFTKFWTADMNLTRDLGKKGKNLARGIGISYEDECFKTRLAFTQTFFQNRDIKPDSGVLLTLVFKTLGEVNSGSILRNRVGEKPSKSKK